MKMRGFFVSHDIYPLKVPNFLRILLEINCTKMSFEITGNLVKKYSTQQINEKFKKREFVIERKEQAGEREFTEYVKFQITQDKCAILDPIEIGENIKVFFNIKGRKYEKDGQTNYFTNIEAWRIDRGIGEDTLSRAEDSQSEGEANENDDDLPF